VLRFEGPSLSSEAVPLVLRLWAPVLLWAAVIFALSSLSDLGTGLGTWDLVLRKIAHATEFAILGALLLRALREELPALALGIAYAASDELHQHFIPGRTGAPLDVAIDAVGVALGVTAWRQFRRADLRR
jgi:VanZ family protein